MQVDLILFVHLLDLDGPGLDPSDTSDAVDALRVRSERLCLIIRVSSGGVGYVATFDIVNDLPRQPLLLLSGAWLSSDSNRLAASDRAFIRFLGEKP